MKIIHTATGKIQPQNFTSAFAWHFSWNHVLKYNILLHVAPDRKNQPFKHFVNHLVLLELFI